MGHKASATSMLISDPVAASQPQGVPTEHLLKYAHAFLHSCIHCLLGTCAMCFTFLIALIGLCLAVCIWEIQHNCVTRVVLCLTAVTKCLLLSSTKDDEHIQAMKVSDHVITTALMMRKTPMKGMWNEKVTRRVQKLQWLMTAAMKQTPLKNASRNSSR